MEERGSDPWEPVGSGKRTHSPGRSGFSLNLKAGPLELRSLNLDVYLKGLQPTGFGTRGHATKHLP